MLKSLPANTAPERLVPPYRFTLSFCCQKFASVKDPRKNNFHYFSIPCRFIFSHRLLREIPSLSAALVDNPVAIRQGLNDRQALRRLNRLFERSGALFLIAR